MMRAGAFRVALWAGILLALCATRPPRAGITHAGAASVFQLPQVTVVYPQGGPDEAVNRVSAERRAAFLRAAEGEREVVVRGDEELTEEELQGNLLILGWDNALLGSGGAPRPFRKTVGGLEFLGVRDTDPSADLLFFARSPFNPESWVMFWSRIAPEVDRFMPLPILGSDWAIFHDFLPIQQGMFTKSRSWPPTRDEFAEKDHTVEQRLIGQTWKTLDSRHYRLHYDPRHVKPEQADRILAVRERALAEAAERFGADIDRLRIELYVYRDRKTKIARTGVPDAVHAVPGRAELHMLPGVSVNDSPHEELHVLARRRFGAAYLSALYEGLAVHYEGSFRGMSPTLQAGVLLEKQQLPSAAELLDEERFRKLPVDVRFPASGLLVDWIGETSGEEALERAYRLESATLAALGKAIGKPPETIEPSFGEWVGKQAEQSKTEVAYLKALARAEERHLVADHEGVIAAIREALELKPNDPQALHGLALAEMRMGDYESAGRNLAELLDGSLPRESPFLIRGRYDLGRLYDIQGKREQALEQYRMVLTLPNRSDLHMLARDAIETPVTAASLQ